MITDRLLERMNAMRNPCVVGLDPVLTSLPDHLHRGKTFAAIGSSLAIFNQGIIDAVHDIVPAVKLQIACYEKYGETGMWAFRESIEYAKSKGLFVIDDAKRNDIGSTALHYAEGHLGEVDVSMTERAKSLDAHFLTVNAYLGGDGVRPFARTCRTYDKGIFVLVKTSNESSGDLQDRIVRLTPDERDLLHADEAPLYKVVALQVDKFAQEQRGERGYSSIGAVVGATYPQQATELRALMPSSLFVVPGYGTQGATGKDVVPNFNEDGYGALISASRSIIHIDKTRNYPQRSREATLAMIADVTGAMRDAGCYPSSWR
jgi:orotidine-5'-phosphate decarboxylase